MGAAFYSCSGEQLNLASALIKRILELQDFETWSGIREDYLPTEYHTLYKVINSHCEKFHEIPTFEDLKYEIRDGQTLEKLFAIESVESEIDPDSLLQYLKNEYTQEQVLNSLEKYVEHSVAFEDAEESISHLHQIIMEVEEKVDLDTPQESMQRIPLFESDEELSKYLSLGLNQDFDYEIQFSPRDLILIGGRRGAGKTIVASNILANVYEAKKTGLYFTIEMDSRSILQRACAIATGVSANRLRLKRLNVLEWELVANWWAERFQDSDKYFELYKAHRDFEKLHQELSSKCELKQEQQLDIVYDPELSIAKIRTEVDKRAKTNKNLSVIIVDYINQVRRSSTHSRQGQYDWTEQIEVSKALKSMAQEYEIPVVSPYQIDASGEARFAKGILDAADAAFILDPYEETDACMGFKCTKMRAAAMKDFVSEMNWESLKIGPDSALSPIQKADESSLKTGEDINDL